MDRPEEEARLSDEDRETYPQIVLLEVGMRVDITYSLAEGCIGKIVRLARKEEKWGLECDDSMPYYVVAMEADGVYYLEKDEGTEVVLPAFEVHPFGSVGWLDEVRHDNDMNVRR